VARRFVGSFVRPLGLDTPATPVLVSAVEAAAREPAPSPRRPSPAARVLRAALTAGLLVGELRGPKGRGRRVRALRRRARALPGRHGVRSAEVPAASTATPPPGRDAEVAAGASADARGQANGRPRSVPSGELR
jgi:hypothetical protein